MSDTICPICGKSNPDTREICENCGAVLKRKPTEPLPPIRPGDMPTRMKTSDLEGTLPSWLRDVRKASKKDDSSPETGEEAPADQAATPPSSGKPAVDPLADLLAGLSSLRDQESLKEPEEEVPSWLRDLQGDISPASQPGPAAEAGPVIDAGQTPIEDEIFPAQEDISSRVGEFNFDENFEPAPPAPAETPDWLNALKEQQNLNEARPAEGAGQSGAGDFSGWLDSLAGANADPSGSPQAQQAPENNETPDWISSLGGEFTMPETAGPESAAVEPAGGELPDWISSLNEAAPIEPETGQPAGEGTAQPATPAELPDWLASMQSVEEGLDKPAGLPAQEPSSTSAELPDWISSLNEATPAAAEPSEPVGEGTPEPAAPAELPDWLATMKSTGEAQGEPLESAAAPMKEMPAPSGDLPDWITRLDEPAPTKPEAAEPSAEAAPPVAQTGDLPDWLAALKSPDMDSPETADSAGTSAETQPAPSSALPDWLVALSVPAQTGADIIDIPADEPPVSSGASTEAANWLSSLPEPSVESQEYEPGWQKTGEGESKPDIWAEPESQPEIPSEVEALIPEQNMDSIISQEPDWLEGLASAPVEEEPAPTPEAAASPEPENLPGGELPSWVQAMRPVESVITAAQADDEDQDEEAEGPLAGLRSVLPIQAGLSAASRPGTYSIKLRTNDSQQAQAALLESLVLSEGQPRAQVKKSEALVNRPVRWIIAAILILGMLVTAALGLNLFPAPAPAPASSPVGLFLNTVNSLPDGAPVLVVLDYQPGFAGELESAAAPVMGHLMGKGARLAFVSTTPLGVLWADRLLQKFSSDYPYQAGTSYVNLGYLPGGANGIKAFAEQPAAVIGRDAEQGDLWNLPALADISSISEPRLSNFAAVVVATDNPDTGRSWIEQARPELNATPMLMVISSQAEPMLLPYLLSGQVQGLVSGLEGGLQYENALGKPGQARAYWDSFGTGMLVSIIVIFLGSAWSLVSGLRARRTSVEQDEA